MNLSGIERRAERQSVVRNGLDLRPIGETGKEIIDSMIECGIGLGNERLTELPPDIRAAFASENIHGPVQAYRCCKSYEYGRRQQRPAPDPRHGADVLRPEQGS